MLFFLIHKLTINITLNNYEITAKQALGAEDTPYKEGSEWSVTKLRSAGHGTARVLGLSLGIGSKGGLGEHGDSVSRQLILTKTSLIERRPENYEVGI